MQINWKKTLYQYFMVTLACVIMGVALNVFYMPNKMLSGGIGGVAVLAYYIGNLPMGATSLICNVPLFFLAYKYMDRQYTIGALYGIVAFSISLDAFHFLSSYQVVHDKLLACIAGGVLYGIGEEVHQHLLHAFGVGVDTELIVDLAVAYQLHIFAHAQFHGVKCQAQKVVDVHFHYCHLSAARVKVAEVEDIVHQIHQQVGVGLDNHAILAAFLLT